MRQWLAKGNGFYNRDVTSMQPELEPAIYKLEVDPITDEFFVAQIQKEFQFPYKVYGKDTPFVERVVKTYNSTDKNVGVLLNGVKGTGKTVTAELICNALQLPVILIHTYYPTMASFLNEIEQDVIIFIDEFEKVFDPKKQGENAGGDILSLMDGVLNGEHRKVFLLTTNDKYVNQNLLQRPSRIRYVKEYGDLDLATIIEIIDDKLIETQYRDECINFMSELKLITIDIVKAIIEEVNIHKESPREFEKVFNVELHSKCKTVSRMIPSENIPGAWVEETIYRKIYINFAKFNEDCVGQVLRFKRLENYPYHDDVLGKILEVQDDRTVVLCEYNDDKDEWLDNKIIYKFEDASVFHSAFDEYRKGTI